MCKLCINSPQCWWCTNTNVKWQDTHFANCATPLVRPISSYPRFKVQTRHNTHLCRLHEKKKREITGHQNPFQSFQFHLFPQSDQPQHSWFSSIADDFGLSNSSWPCKRLAWQSQQMVVKFCCAFALICEAIQKHKSHKHFSAISNLLPWTHLRKLCCKYSDFTLHVLLKTQANEAYDWCARKGSGLCHGTNQVVGSMSVMANSANVNCLPSKITWTRFICFLICGCASEWGSIETRRGVHNVWLWAHLVAKASAGPKVVQKDIKLR